MDKRSYLLTSESVTEGHPDKIADQVSDSVLDAVMADDPNGRVACETMVTTGLAIVAGEITDERLRGYSESRPPHDPRHRVYASQVRIRCRYLRCHHGDR